MLDYVCVTNFLIIIMEENHANWTSGVKAHSTIMCGSLPDPEASYSQLYAYITQQHRSVAV